MKTQTTKKLLSILLVLIMVLSMVPFSALPAFAEGPEVTEVSTWGELLNAVNSDKTYIKLMNSIEDIVPDDELPTKHRLQFNGGVDYVLDLNGYSLEVINHINEFYTGEFSMIEVSGSGEDKSSLEIKNGTIAFDNWATKSNRKAKGVVSVEGDSTLVATYVSMSNKYTGSVVHAASSAKVTLDGGEYTVQNGFAIYLKNQASLTLDGPYIHTIMGDSAYTQYVDGYGALYSESNGELVINDALFKSGIQVTHAQLGAFSVATHEVTINGSVLSEDVFDGPYSEAKTQNKEYYWYAYNGKSLCKTENTSFVNVVRVISYEKKYPIKVESGIAMVGDVPVTEAVYGQTVTVVAHTPEAGMEFVRWSADVVMLDNYSSSTTFTMPPSSVNITALYGKESVKSVSVTVGDIIPGKEVNKTEITLANGVILEAVEWREEGALKGDYDVFRAGKSYTVKMLVYPPEGNKFGDTMTATVNGKNATINGNAQYAYIDYTFETTPSVGFAVVYDGANEQLGVGGKVVLDTALMGSQSAEFKTALDAGQVTYQWYRNGEAVEGATEAVYNFTDEDVYCMFYVAVTANGKTNYGHNITCSSNLYKLYLNATEIEPGGKVPYITAATPGVSIDVESMTIYEILGNNSYGNPQSIANTVLIPGKSYRLVGKVITDANVELANNSNVYINGELMAATLDTGRFFYDFKVSEADFPVYYTANGEIGIGVTLTVDVEKMCNENPGFKHAVDIQKANPTYKTVFYQWYKNGEAINGATKDSYTVRSADKNSMIHCQVTLVDGKYGIGAQHSITNVITVINVDMPRPKNGQVIIPKNEVYADGVNVKIGWYSPLGAQMSESDTYEEGIEYDIFINFEAKEGLSLDFSGEKTRAYIYGALAPEGGSSGTGIAYYTSVIAIHAHMYSDTVWTHDEDGHWQPCIITGCPDPNEEWTMYTYHTGGTATCQTPGECAICGREYLADHDFSVPDYQYVDDMKCANFCENCDVWSDWSYHEGGVSDCQNKAVCEFCHHEYGKLGEHSMADAWTQENGQHFHKCTIEGCTHTDTKVNCSGGTATCTAKAVCEVCGGEYGELLAHVDADSNGKCDGCEKDMPSTPDNSGGDTTGGDTTGGNQDGSNTGNSNGNTDTPDATEPPAASDTPDDTPEEPKGGLGAGAIVGIVIGSVAVAGVGGFSIFWFAVQKKSFADLGAAIKGLIEKIKNIFKKK